MVWEAQNHSEGDTEQTACQEDGPDGSRKEPVDQAWGRRNGPVKWGKRESRDVCFLL